MKFDEPVRRASGSSATRDGEPLDGVYPVVATTIDGIVSAWTTGPGERGQRHASLKGRPRPARVTSGHPFLRLGVEGLALGVRRPIHDAAVEQFLLRRNRLEEHPIA